jgi:hypothetical protein
VLKRVSAVVLLHRINKGQQGALCSPLADQFNVGTITPRPNKKKPPSANWRVSKGPKT